jgi:hypothetical protein
VCNAAGDFIHHVSRSWASRILRRNKMSKRRKFWEGPTQATEGRVLEFSEVETASIKQVPLSPLPPIKSDCVPTC